MERRCGARTKSGKACRQPKGARTSHPGWGRCSLHGGCSPNGEKAAANEAAMAAAREGYGGEIDLTPFEALLYTVRRGAQLVAYWQRAVFAAGSAEALARAQEQESKALADLNSWSDKALRAGVSKMQVEFAARLADSLTAMHEEGLAALEKAMGRQFTAEERTAYAEAIGSGMARLEGPTIDGVARDA